MLIGPLVLYDGMLLEEKKSVSGREELEKLEHFVKHLASPELSA